MNDNKNSSFGIPAAIVVGCFVIAGAIVMTNTKAPSSTPITGTQTPSVFPQALMAPSADPRAVAAKPADSTKVNAVNQPFIGNPNAPLTIAYWFDYQCPFCHENEENDMPSLIKDYVDTDKAKIIFKDLEFLGDDSQTLGKAARAVWATAPDQFSAWHKAIFDAQGEENSGWASSDEILSVTTSVLGSSTANAVMALAAKNDVQYQKAIDADKAEGSLYGITSTPTFMIGDQVVTGYVDYATIKKAIDTALSAK